MRFLQYLGIVAASACLTFAASAASHESHNAQPAALSGSYMEARTADVYIGECFRNSEVGLVGDLGVMGWSVSEGSFDGVNLDGLSVIAVVRANSTIGDIHQDYLPSKAVLIVDEKANLRQRVALQNLARQLGGALVRDVVAVSVEPIAMSFEGGDVHSMVGTLTAGNLVELRTRAIERTDKICSHEKTVYDPMSSAVDHAMPAYTITNSFRGKGLDTTWSSPYKLSAFVGTFALGDGGVLISQNK